MTNRKNISTGTKWEDIVGYSRAVVFGNQIEISGTVAVDDEGKVVGVNDPFQQTQFILNKIKKVLTGAGFLIDDVIRTRIYVTDISQWEQVAKAHGEVFNSIKPATSMIEISALISPEYLVEIEVTALK